MIGPGVQRLPWLPGCHGYHTFMLTYIQQEQQVNIQQEQQRMKCIQIRLSSKDILYSICWIVYEHSILNTFTGSPAIENEHGQINPALEDHNCSKRLVDVKHINTTLSVSPQCEYLLTSVLISGCQGSSPMFQDDKYRTCVNLAASQSNSQYFGSACLQYCLL